MKAEKIIDRHRKELIQLGIDFSQEGDGTFTRNVNIGDGTIIKEIYVGDGIFVPENCWICDYCDNLYDCDNNFDEDRVRKCIVEKTKEIIDGTV